MLTQRSSYMTVAVALMVQATATATVRYAKVGGSPTGPACVSWADACSLSRAIEVAVAVFDKEGRVEFRNSILWDNTAVKEGKQIYSGSYGASDATYSDIQGGYYGTGNLDADPQLGALGLEPTSPCKNAGSNAALPTDDADLDWDGQTTQETIPKDVRGFARVRLGAVDIGAHEIFSDQPPGGGSEGN